MSLLQTLGAKEYRRHRDRAMRAVFDGLLIAMRPTIVCDIGSYDGEEAARFKRLLPEAQVFAFEASPTNFDRFIQTRADLIDVEKRHLALSDHDGAATFFVLDAEPEGRDWRRMASSLVPRSDDVPATPVTVPSARLDTVFEAELKTDQTWGLWIDVEGALDRVLDGADLVLRRTLVLKVEVERAEFWQGQVLADGIRERIEGCGFTWLGDTYVESQSAQSDVTFINNEWMDLVQR